ncbi:MAG: hypothetical protein JXL97_16625 [Bacteroidales bacterium]|nr:hypothetical protein [Bacteroidales bacterium]
MEDYPLHLFTPTYKQFYANATGNIDLQPPQDEYYFIKEINVSGNVPLIGICYMGLSSDSTLKGIKSGRIDSYGRLKLDFPIMLQIDPQKKFRFTVFISSGDCYGDYLYISVKKDVFDKLNANLQKMLINGQIFEAYDKIAPMGVFPSWQK